MRWNSGFILTVIGALFILIGLLVVQSAIAFSPRKGFCRASIG